MTGTATPALLDFDIMVGRTRTAWLVFDTITGSDIETGHAANHEAATFAARACIAKHTTRPVLVITRTPGGWSVAHPTAGLVPLPLTSAATEALALAYARTLPLAAGRTVEVR